MKAQVSETVPSKIGGYRLTPFRVAVAYAAFGLGLLVVSDLILPRYVADARLLRDLQAAKGALEILASAAFIYVLVAWTQQELRVKERAMDEAPVGISITDPDRDDNPLVYVNVGFEEMTGYSSVECLGRNCRFLQGDHTDPDAVAEMRAAIDDERPVSVELLNYRKDGTPFWNRVAVVPVLEDGRVTHFLGIQQDVTERRASEQRLSVLNRILRHDLRNKLTVVLGRVDQIEAGTGDLNDQTAAIRTATEDLLETAEKIRRFDRVIAADEEGLRTVDLATVFTHLVASLPEDGRVDLRAPESAEVRAHATVETALRDLLSLIASGGRAPSVTVEHDGDHVVVEFADAGGVLSEADLDPLQEDAETPLEHLDGIELWLVKWTVERSNGEFVVDDEGDAPVVTLRFRRPAETSAAGSRTGRQRPGTRTGS